MPLNTNKNRILFLDVMRAIAVLLMLEGHTIHALLSEEYINFNSFFYTAWNFIRGLTAPIFIITAGTVFTYLLYRNSVSTPDKQRIKKGIKRALILLAFGYFLRFPTFKISGLYDITEKQWRIFFSFDALHLIGFGILLIILVSLISKKLARFQSLIFPVLSLIIIFISPAVESVEWINILPHYFASFFTTKYGSIFPLFPWVAYIFAGASIGYELSNKGEQGRSTIAVWLVVIGAVLFVLSMLPGYISEYGTVIYNYFSQISIQLQRIAFVFVLNSAVIYLTFGLNKLPRIVNLFGKHSLSIYVMHLIMIYGSAIIPGLSYIYGKSLTISESIFAFILLTLAMLVMSFVLEYLQKNRSEIRGKFLNIIKSKSGRI